MSAKLSRRSFLGWSALALSPAAAFAQGGPPSEGFAGLGASARGFAEVKRGVVLRFPEDHGAHPDFRIEWWYVTANLKGEDGADYGAQWTLFRQAAMPGPQGEGWANQQVWMGHAAVTSATEHFFAERFARGGVGQAGVELSPFRAFIDNWSLQGSAATAPLTLSPLEVTAAGPNFAYTLRLTATRDLVLQGDHGFSQKSDRGQASYYYSQPNFHAQGVLTFGDRMIPVTGRAWMDREWSSQPLAADQSGWDWFSLQFDDGDKLMLFRLRHTDGTSYRAGTWIGRDGSAEVLPSDGIELSPVAWSKVGAKSIPTKWRLAIPARGVSIETEAINPQSWMALSFPYWEGPVRCRGTHAGIGYLEMTGY